MNIAALLQDPLAVWHLRQSLPETALGLSPTLSFFGGWEDLISEAEIGPPDVCVVDPSVGAVGPNPGVAILELERLKRLMSPDQIILYGDHSGKRQARSLGPGCLGIPIVLAQDGNKDPRAILRGLARSIVRREVRSLVDRGLNGPPDSWASFFLDAVAGWPPVSSVAEQAAKACTAVPSLRRRCQVLRIPCPRELLRWSRVFETAALASVGVRNRGRIAHLVGLSGPSSLSRLVRELTDLSAAQILDGSGLQQVVEAFRIRVKGCT